MLERDDAVRAVATLVDGLGSGHGGVLFVAGEAGLGKSAVLDHACKVASGPGRVGQARGDAMESALPFGLMSQMTEDLGGPSLLGEEAEGRSAEDTRAAKFHAVLEWLRDASGHSPLLLAFEDLHWSDLDSLALLSFVARRIADVPVGVVATLRPWPAAAETVALALAETGVATVERLRPLTAGATAELLAAKAGRRPSPQALAEAEEATAGNPLLVELAAVILGEGGSWRAVDQRSGGPVAAARSLVLRRFADLPEAGTGFARAASVLSRRFRPDVAAALAHLDEAQAEEALEALGRAGLVRPAGPGLAELTYPLLSQALYEDLGSLVRDQLHARAFRLLVERGLDGEAAEHAVLGNLVGDADAIRTVTAAGVAALRAGAVATAVRTLERAVALAGENPPDTLLLVMGEALLAGGRLERAVAVYERVLDGRPLSNAYGSVARRMLGRALFLSGDAAAGRRRLEEAAALAPDGRGAVRALIDLSRAAWLTAGPAGALPPAVQAREAARHADEASRVEAGAAWGFVAYIGGDAAGLDATEAGRASAADVPSVLRDLSWHWGTLRNAGRAAKYAERFDDAQAVFDEMFARAERAGSPHAMASLAAHQADTLLRRGRLGDAEALAAQATSFAELAPMAAPFAAAVEALLLHHADRPEESEEACARAERAAAGQGQWLPLMRVRHVRALRAGDEGRLDRACRLYAELEAETARLGLAEPCVVPWARHAVAALAAAGRPAAAERVRAGVEGRSRSLPCRWPRIAAATGAAVLAEEAGDPGQAERHLRTALALHGDTDLPLEHAETLLLLGGLLRRSGRAVDARRPLRDALALAEGAGAARLARLAGDELAVAGGRRRRPRQSPDRFTPQEQRVAELAAAGRSCREIAGQLSLSTRTIETHLRRVYRKVGVHSQRELMARAAADPLALRPGRGAGGQNIT